MILSLANIGCGPRAEKPVAYRNPTIAYSRPSNRQELHEECRRIRQEIARQNTIVAYAAQQQKKLEQEKERNASARGSGYLSMLQRSGLLTPASPARARLNALAMKAPQTVAILESRAAEIGCPGACSGNGSAQQESGLSFDECFDRCTELTEYTSEQCFDKCRE